LEHRTSRDAFNHHVNLRDRVCELLQRVWQAVACDIDADPGYLRCVTRATAQEVAADQALWGTNRYAGQGPVDPKQRKLDKSYLRIFLHMTDKQQMSILDQAFPHKLYEVGA
jgi:hypothetical protein